MTILFENESGFEFDFPMEEQLEQLITFVSDYVKCPYESEVSVTMVTKEEIHQINQETRQVDRPTDVLSFPMMEYDKPGDFDGDSFLTSISVNPETEELILGDIVLCADVICEQAEEYGHSRLREFSFLVVHSMLHLFGYDHMEEDERLEMEARQKEIMDALKIYR